MQLETSECIAIAIVSVSIVPPLVVGVLRRNYLDDPASFILTGALVGLGVVGVSGYV